MKITKVTSSIKQPILFFKECLNIKYIDSLKRNFYISYINNYEYDIDNVPIKINEQNESVEYYCDGIDASPRIFYFKSELYFTLKFELEYSLFLFDYLMITNSHQYLQLLKNELISIKSEINGNVFQKYPFCEDAINELITSIDKKLGTYVPQINPENLDAIVYSIFGFLNYNNRFNQKIMNDNDFNRLIDAIKEMVNEERLIRIESIDKINIPTDLLRYCFYKLHINLYGVKPQKSYFIDFMKNNLTQFSEYDKDVLKQSFSKKPHRQDDKYIPLILRQ
jgi:hypothetical protein